MLSGVGGGRGNSCYVLNVRGRGGYQNRTFANKRGGGSKFRSFCEDVIIECPHIVFKGENDNAHRSLKF